MNNNMLVSIVTPVFNMDKYIEETIESVLLQNYKCIEYIIIDDGSTDNTRKVINKYKNKANIILQENIGQAKTLNRGWMVSRGTYIGYLSADDLLKRNAVSSMVDKINNTNYAVVYPDFELIDSNGCYIKNVVTEEFDIKRLTIDLVCQPGPGAIFRKEIFNSLGGWNENLSHVADFEFWLRAARLGEFIRDPEILASFRVHEGSGSVRKISKCKSNEIIRVMESYWSGENSNAKNRSLACANIISAKSHAQSARYAEALRAWVQAIRYSPSKSLSLAAFRSIISGLTRKIFIR
jgi:glycosyltransferase involved in cell wall biosynthesis